MANLTKVTVTCDIYNKGLKKYILNIPSKIIFDFDNIYDFYERYESELNHLAETMHFGAHTDISKGIYSMDIDLTCFMGDDGKYAFKQIVNMVKEYVGP